MAQRSKRGSPKHRFWVIGLVVGLGLAFIVPLRGYYHQRAQLRQEQIDLGREIAKRDALAARLRALPKPEVQEALARERHFVRPGERTFRVTRLPKE